MFFDNLQVVHTRSPILEEAHYYPFGLTMAGISSRAAGSMINKHKYNGIELNEAFDVDIYDAHYRNLDVQIGRWWQIDPKVEEDQEDMSPYSAMANDPVLKSDPLGDIATDGDGDVNGDPVTGAAVGALVLESGITTAGAGAALVAGSAVAPVALIIYHPESLLSGGASAAQMEFRVERQTITKTPTSALVAQRVQPLGSTLFANGTKNLTNQPITTKSILKTEGQQKGGGKNAQHANQKARAAAEKRYNEAKENYNQLKSKPNKTKEDKLALDKAEKAMKHEKQKMDNTGENHSQKAKGSN